MQRILITGASGTIGREILRLLCALPKQDFDITVFDKRTPKSVSVFEQYIPYHTNLTVAYGDITNTKDVEQICKNKDTVIHLAAIIPPLADQKPRLAEQVNVEGTKNLIYALQKHSPKAFLVYSSSISVYGDRTIDPWICASDPLKPSSRDYYARTTIAAEQLIQESALDWTVFRLTAIMGVDNHKLSKIMFYMPLETKIEIATPQDAARAFVSALNHKAKLRFRIFNLSGGEGCRITYKQLLTRSFAIMGLGKCNFKQYSFATQNFHCGYYADGDVLESILHFRHDTIENYFHAVHSAISFPKRLLITLFRPLIKAKLQSLSEPLHAIKISDRESIWF